MVVRVGTTQQEAFFMSNYQPSLFGSDAPCGLRRANRTGAAFSLGDTMTEKQAHGMLLFHQRHARAFRQVAADPKTKKADRDRLLRDADVADMRAAECQAILQVARMEN